MHHINFIFVSIFSDVLPSLSYTFPELCEHIQWVGSWVCMGRCFLVMAAGLRSFKGGTFLEVDSLLSPSLVVFVSHSFGDGLLFSSHRIQVAFCTRHNPIYGSLSLSLAPPNPSKDVGPRPSTYHLTYHFWNARHLACTISKYPGQHLITRNVQCIHLCTGFWSLQLNTELAFYKPLLAIQRRVGSFINHCWYISIACIWSIDRFRCQSSGSTQW